MRSWRWLPSSSERELNVPFQDTTLLVAVMIFGAVTTLGIVLMIVMHKVGRHTGDRRRSHADDAVRPILLQVVADDRIAPAALEARGSRGRAVERVALAFLAQTRGEAHELLAQLLARRGFTARMIRQASRSGWHRRGRAAELLGVIGSPDAQRALERLVLNDRRPEVRVVASRALGLVGTATAASTLLRSLDQPMPVSTGIIVAALLEVGPESIPALRAALHSRSTNSVTQRVVAAEALGLLEATQAWPDLVALISDTNLEVRVSAVRALGRLGVPDAADAVSRCLQPDEPLAVRAVAARSLGRIGDPRSVPFLASSVEERDYWVAHRAAEALAGLGTAGSDALSRLAVSPGPASMHAREALAYATLLPVGYLSWIPVVTWTPLPSPPKLDSKHPVSPGKPTE